MPQHDAFIESDKFRRAVFAELAAGETEIARIAKKHHIVARAADRAAEDLAKHGLAKKMKDGHYELTEEGKGALAQAKRDHFL